MLLRILDLISGAENKEKDNSELTYEILRQQIRELAYKKWEDAGHPWGKDKDFWIEAEEELFGENPLQFGGYLIKRKDGSKVMICPINSEVPVEQSLVSL